MDVSISSTDNILICRDVFFLGGGRCYRPMYGTELRGYSARYISNRVLNKEKNGVCDLSVLNKQKKGVYDVFPEYPGSSSSIKKP